MESSDYNDSRYPQKVPFQNIPRLYEQQPIQTSWKTEAGWQPHLLYSCWGNGTIRTQTWFLENAVFSGEDLEFDFEIRALEGNAIIKFVRVIKL